MITVALTGHRQAGNPNKHVAKFKCGAVVEPGTGNKGLYITGGVSLTVAMALKQLGWVSGTKKKLGQRMRNCAEG